MQITFIILIYFLPKGTPNYKNVNHIVDLFPP